MIWTLLFAGLVIGSNNFAAAVAIGALGGKKYWLKIISVFGIFEFIVPLIGVWLGEQLSGYIGSLANILSALILAGLAAVSFYSAAQPPKIDQKILARITSIRGLILLELGLSLDNLIAGFGLGIGESELPPLLLAAIIAFFSVTYTFIGLTIGHKLAKNKKWQNYAQFGAGILLLILAVLVWFELL
ncbi:MAG: manganese efflux pump [Crocinitomicaceae bacterium]